MNQLQLILTSAKACAYRTFSNLLNDQRFLSCYVILSQYCIEQHFNSSMFIIIYFILFSETEQQIYNNVCFMFSLNAHPVRRIIVCTMEILLIFRLIFTSKNSNA